MIMAKLLLLFASMVSTVTATTTMKAAQATGQAKLGDFSKIALAEIPVPTPGHGEVLIRVVASSVNPVDWKLLEPGSFGPVSPIRFPHTLGFDIAGTIAAVGSGCDRLKVNDTVWADLGKAEILKLGLELGAYAEYAIADESQVGHAPKSMPLRDAGTLPLVSLTSYQALPKRRGPGPAS